MIPGSGICRPQLAAQARERAGEVAVALFRVRLRPEFFDQDFSRLAVRASEGEVSEQNEGLAFERDRRTMPPQEIRIWPSSSMYSTLASLVTIFNEMYRSVSVKSTTFADAFRRPRLVRRPSLAVARRMGRAERNPSSLDGKAGFAGLNPP